MTDIPAATHVPRHVASNTALATLETAARRELAQLAAALPASAAAADPLLAHLAWDLGLSGNEVAPR
jgi:hypothetical protein